MSAIYLVLLQTDTGLGRLIRRVSGYPYNHAALCLDRRLLDLLSFARYRQDVPLSGGFVHETPARYAWRKREIQIKVYCIPDPCGALVRRIAPFLARPDAYRYNTLGALASLFGWDCPVRDAYTCVSFAAHVMGLHGVRSVRALDQAQPQPPLYAGGYTAYVGNVERAQYVNDPYLVRQGLLRGFAQTLRHFQVLFARRRNR